MSETEREELENDERFLKMLLEFHHTYKGELSMTDKEREQYVDTILERMWEIKQRLKD